MCSMRLMNSGVTSGIHQLFTCQGLSLFFFSSRRTVSGETRVTIPSFNICCTNSSSVQRARPAGGSLQVNAITRASCSSLISVPVGACGLSSNAACKPSSANRNRIRRIVFSLTYSIFLISADIGSLLPLFYSKSCSRALVFPVLLEPAVTHVKGVQFREISFGELHAHHPQRFVPPIDLRVLAELGGPGSKHPCLADKRFLFLVCTIISIIAATTARVFSFSRKITFTSCVTSRNISFHWRRWQCIV